MSLNTTFSRVSPVIGLVALPIITLLDDDVVVVVVVVV
tara:strand:- start:66 stop:179 length:114 start_codon:yes stop_codon:yes gene_type:complete